eukprot:SAG31_NODE_16891_length_691_cov_1.211149_1_plen_91_part_00
MQTEGKLCALPQTTPTAQWANFVSASHPVVLSSVHLSEAPSPTTPATLSFGENGVGFGADEGFMVTGTTTDATDELVQANIVSVGYKNIY